MRRVVHSVTACLLILTGLAFSPLAQPETALADDTTITTCDEASLETALTAVQNSGGGKISLSCNATSAFSSQKVITSDVTIVGNGAVIFDGGGTTGHFRVDSGARLALVNLTLQNGAPAGAGGAILNDGGTVEVTASTFSNNNPAGRGGAISNNGLDGMLTITASTFSDNSAGDFGGAIYNQFGAVTITASTFSGNGAGQSGGAISNGGAVTITASTFSNNSAPNSVGGAIGNNGTLTITSSTFSGNSAGDWGGAIFNDRGGTVTVTASTFSGNSAGDSGGAIYNSGGDAITITASTFSDNSVLRRFGGAIYNSGGTLTIAGSTFSGNSTNQLPVAETVLSAGGSATIGSSVLAHSGDTSDIRSNCLGLFTSAGYNLSNDTSCGFTNTGDRQGPDRVINLGPLQDNGGPTHTMLPEDGSEAIEAIPAAVCLDVSTTSDQRGISRPQGDCEIGAVELERATESVTVCANPYTGELSMQPEQGCPSGMTELSLPSVDPVTLCIAAYTGAITWSPSGNCNGNSRVHIVPDDGPLNYCQNIHTGRLRYSDAGECTSHETPGVIPGSIIVN